MPFAAVSVRWPCERPGSRGQARVGIVCFAWLVGGIRGDCREAPKGLHGLEADASKQFDPGDHQPGAPGDDVDRSERQLLPSRELRDPLDQEFQVGLDRPNSVPLGFGLPVSATRSILPA